MRRRDKRERELEKTRIRGTSRAATTETVRKTRVVSESDPGSFTRWVILCAYARA